MAICVKHNTFKSVLDVTTTCHEDIMVVRIQCNKTTVRIILAYAPQENEPCDIRENFFNELEIEVSNSKFLDEIPLIIGDLNSKIAFTNNNIQELTPNGTLLHQLIKNQDLEVINFHTQCTGKWTHVIRTTSAKSVLDYIITDKSFETSIESMLIDEECLLTPYSLSNQNNTNNQQFTDHNAIAVKLKIQHQSMKKVTRKSWHITNEGLVEFKKITNNENFLEYDINNIQSTYDSLESKIQDIMAKCFKLRSSKKENKISNEFMEIYTIISKFAKKGRTQRRVAKVYIQKIMEENNKTITDIRKKKICRVIENITVNNKFSPNGFWQLCKNSRKQEIGGSIITNEGTEIFGEDIIKNAYIDEFKYRLRKRDIDPDLEYYENQKEKLCNILLSEEDHKETNNHYSKEEYNKVKKMLKKGKSPGRDGIPPEIFINAGEKLENEILGIMNLFKQSNKIPSQWSQVMISTIFKNKGSKKYLVNHRGIFLKQVLTKMYEKMNLNRSQDTINQIDSCQAGGLQNRSTADQTFLLRAAIDHAVYINKPLFLTLYDYSQCFDSLWLTDSLISLLKLGVEKEVVSIIKELNESANIIVKTSSGTTEEFQVKSVVQQGSVSGGLLCVASLAEIIKENLGIGFQIGAAVLKALAFVDDIITLNHNHIDAYTAHESVVWFSAKKRLTLNAPKCMSLIINKQAETVVPRLKVKNIIVPTVKTAP